MPIRYLDADQVKIQTSAPAFVEPGHCCWCNNLLTGRATKYCRWDKDSIYSNMSDCAAFFFDYWYTKPKFKRAVFLRDNFTCQGCGYHKMREDRPWLPNMSNLECDHIIPMAKGGLTTMDNLQTLCKECNRKKGTKVADVFEEELPRVIPSRDNSSCPWCQAHGYRVLPWEPPLYLDPLMIKVECNNCGEASYIGPPPMGRRRKI